MKKKVLLLVLACAMMAMTAIQVSAQEVSSGDSTVPVNGTAQATVITLTVPTSLSFAINPNTETTFLSAPADMVSATPAKLDVDIIAIRAAGDSAAKVVAADSIENWSQLGVTDTKSKIALGIKAGDQPIIWAPAEDATPIAEVTDKAGTVKVTPNGTQQIGLEGKHGMSWKETTSMDYNLYLRISLTEE